MISYVPSYKLFLLEDGSYLLHCGWYLRAHQNNNTPLFRLDATFYEIKSRFYPETV
jgi:hypothetical protein